MSRGVAYGNGAIAGATLEPYVTTQPTAVGATTTPAGQAGGYTFPTAAKAELLGGWDTVTDLRLGGNYLQAGEDSAPFVQLDAPAGAAVVTALTSLVADINGRGLNSGSGSESLAQAEAAILDGLGLSPDLDLLALNPLAEAQAGDTAPFLTEARLLDTQAIVFDAAGLDILPLLAIDIFNNGSLDLDDPAALLSILTSVAAHVAQPLAQTLATLVAASNADLDARAAAAPDNASLITGTLAEEEVAQDGEGRAAFDAALSDGATAALQSVTQAYTGANLQALVAAKLSQSAQVAAFTATAGTISSAPVIHYTLQFTQPVSGIGAGAFQLIEGSGLADAFISSVTTVPGSGGASYDIAVSTGIGQGTLGTGFTGSGVLDAAGKPLTSGLFEPGQTYAAPFDFAAAQGLAAGDFNGDGKLDLVEAETNGLPGDGLTIFLNNGDGTFTATGQITLAVQGARAVPAVGDFNGDGKLDIVTSIAGENDVAVLLGNGDGTFQAPVRTATGNDPEALAVGDLDGDGRADVVTLNEGDGTISVLLGQGDGTFLAAPSLVSGVFLPNQGFASSIALADLNGDGKLDIVATDSVNNVVDIFLGNGDGTFGPELSVPTARGPTGVAVGDINGDGIPDIVTADYYNNQVSVLLGNGDGTFQADRPIALSTLEPAVAVEGGNREPLGVAIADVNNDGKADLVINGATPTLVLIGDGTGNFQLADEDDDSLQETSHSQALVAGDFNGDGRTDFATPGVAGIDNYGIDVHLNAPQTVLNATASPVFINRAALAQPVLTQIAGPGTLNVSGTSYTLDLGTVSQGQAAQVLQFALTNLLGEFSSDAFSGTFATASAPGFTVTGDTLPGPLQAGQSYDGLTIATDATTIGVHTETITFAPRDQSATETTFATVPGTDTEQATTASVDGADVAGELPALTLVVTDDVVPATDVAVLGAPASVTFGNAHVGDVRSQALPLANTAGTGAPDLGVTATASGGASVSGAVAGLVNGETDSADVSVGLDTGTAGAVTGTVILVPVSDPSGGSPVALASVPVAVSGSVYRLAAPSATVTAARIVHVGDPGTVALTVANTGTADGYTENLLATLAGATGGLTVNTATTGEVAAGASDDASLSLSVSTAAAGVVSGTATLNLISDGGTGSGSLDGLGQTNLGTQVVPVSVTVYNYAQAGLSTQGGSLQQGASAGTYVLNLGTTTAGSTPLLADLSLLNLAGGPADTLGGSFSISGSTGFTNTGFAATSGIAAGQTLDEGTIVLSAATAGSYSETIVLNPTDTAQGESSTQQAAQTITVSGVVLAPTVGTPLATAVETLNSPSSIVFANAHVGTVEQQAVSISNTATPPANALDVTPSATGLATATGAISLLQPASTDTADVQVGLDTSSAGLVSGSVTLAGTSDDGPGNTAPLTGAPIVSVSGRVYRTATVSIAPVVVNVHVGDPGTAKVTVSNTAAADGYSESLIALLASETAGLSSLSMAPTGDITAGASTALGLSFSTATAGTITGTATVALTSDGGAIDGLGTTALPDVTVPVTVNVANYAQAGIATQGGTLLAGPTDGSYVLDLGTTTEGAGSLSADLSLLNESGGPSDLLGGSFIVTGGSAFTNTGFGPAASLAAGGTADAGTISLSTATPGAFSETIVLTPTDTSVAGINMVRSTETITVNGTITPTGTAQGDVHLVMFDGLHYDLQGEGDYVLARSTVAGDSFSVQMRAGPLNHNPGTTYATRIAAQLGQDVITFNPAGTGQLEVDGAADPALGAVGTRQAFAGGTLDVLAPDRYALTWSTGEVLDVTTQSDHLDVSITLRASDGSGSVEGLLGPNNGPEDEFQLPDGRVLPAPSSPAELLSVFADAWSVPATVSLLNGALPGTPPSMRFLAANGGTPLALDVKQDPGELLTGSLLSGSGGVVIEGTLRNLSLDKLIDFDRSDMIDLTDVFGPALSIGWTSAEHLQIAEGQQSGELTFATPMAASAIQTRADGHGGTLVWFIS